MDKFAIAVKAFIVQGENVLLIKRRDNDVHKPGVWEIPGGRLDPGEDALKGVERETVEEVGLHVSVRNPIRVHCFTRDDGQQITMIVFLCNPTTQDVQLSEEHTAYEWTPLEKAKEKIVPEFHEEVDLYMKFFHDSQKP